MHEGASAPLGGRRTYSRFHDREKAERTRGAGVRLVGASHFGVDRIGTSNFLFPLGGPNITVIRPQTVSVHNLRATCHGESYLTHLPDRPSPDCQSRLVVGLKRATASRSPEITYPAACLMHSNTSTTLIIISSVRNDLTHNASRLCRAHRRPCPRAISRWHIGTSGAILIWGAWRRPKSQPLQLVSPR
jgi:hypothetical protein